MDAAAVQRQACLPDSFRHIGALSARARLFNPAMRDWVASQDIRDLEGAHALIARSGDTGDRIFEPSRLPNGISLEGR